MTNPQKPTDTYKTANVFISKLNCDDVIKSTLLKLCYLLQTPGNSKNIKEIPEIITNLSIKHNLSNADLKITFHFLENLEIYTHEQEEFGGKKHPLFFGLLKLKKKIKDPSITQVALINHYISVFNIKKIDINKLNKRIYYKDVYFFRDVILDESNELNICNHTSTQPYKQQQSILSQVNILLEQCSKGSNRRAKLIRFIDLFSQARLPGVLQKKHTQTLKESIDSFASETGVKTNIRYPTKEDSEHLKTLCRVTPPSGSKLSVKDDRFALQGLLNQLASRNTPNITDMHRLPFTFIRQYLLFLLPNNLELFAYNYILLITGLDPERLAHAKFRSYKTSTQTDCLINTKTFVLSYSVLNTPNHSLNTIMKIKLPKGIIAFVKRPNPFKNIKELSSSIAKAYSEHATGQTPTPNRIANSSILLYSKSNLTPIEVSYISGNISPSLRAQAHYYPIKIERINREITSTSQKFISEYLSKRVSNQEIRKQIQSLSVYNTHSLNGNIGSLNSVPIIQLQKTLDEIVDRMILVKQGIKIQTGTFIAQKVCDFIQLQHLYLYIVEQLSFCSRKFGKKTNYSISLTSNKVWGSEKASPIFSLERKLIPLNKTLKKLIQTAQSNFVQLEKFTQTYNYNLTSKFNNPEFKLCSQSNPRPITISLNSNLNTINIQPMNTKDFTEALSHFGIKHIPKTKTSRSHLFKHIIAAELLGNVPQTLLDELMTHDRDGLDFYAPWSTAAPQCMELLDTEIAKIFKQLNIKIISIGELI